MTHFDRRQFGLGLFTVSTAMLSGARFAMAEGAGDKRFILVLLRGGLDGLAAVPPYGDPDYVGARAGLALPPPGSQGGVLAIDGMFALHPSLAPLHGLWMSKELAVVHAVGLKGYTGRSHFDAQDLLETGAALPRSVSEGWLNRALAGLTAAPRPAGLAAAQSMPLAMTGPEDVASWAPSVVPEADPDFLARVERLYNGYPELLGALRAANKLREAAGSDMPHGRARANFAALAKGAASIMKPANGPRVGFLEIGGWDTHANQGLAAGTLARNLGQLAEGLLALKEGLGPAWSQTAVLVVTEFGRTVAQNGSKGTDHGTGGIALALGGAVRGGQVLADWPGLSKRALFEGRDLMTTTDLRSLFWAALVHHLGLDPAFVRDRVFAETPIQQSVESLFRAG